MNMKRRCSHTNLPFRHREMLAVHTPAYIRSVGIQCCHNLKLFNIQFIKTILLCCGTEKGFFCHYQPPGVGFGSVHLPGNFINGFLWVFSQDDVLCQGVVQFIDQLLTVAPYPFTEILAVNRPRLIDDLADLLIIQCGKVPTNTHTLLNLIGCVIIAGLVNISHCAVNAVKLVSKHDFNALLGLQLQGFKSADMESCRCIFKLLDPSAIDCIFLTVLNILVYIPFQFSKFLCVQHPLCFCKGYPVVRCKTLIPCSNLTFKLLLCLSILFFNICITLNPPLVCCLFKQFKTLLPVFTVIHLLHRPDFPVTGHLYCQGHHSVYQTGHTVQAFLSVLLPSAFSGVPFQPVGHPPKDD